MAIVNVHITEDNKSVFELQVVVPDNLTIEAVRNVLEAEFQEVFDRYPDMSHGIYITEHLCGVSVAEAIDQFEYFLVQQGYQESDGYLQDGD